MSITNTCWCMVAICSDSAFTSASRRWICGESGAHTAVGSAGAPGADEKLHIAPAHQLLVLLLLLC